MAADHRVVRTSPARHVEPRQMAGGSLGRLAFGVEFHDSVGRAEAQAGHGVDDHAQAVDPAQAVVPAVRARAVEVREEFPVPGSAQFRLDLSRERCRGGDVPLRQQARVNQHVIRLDVNHRPVTQPVDELVAIGGREHFCERVVFAFLDNAVCEREQVQIVVAEDRQRALAQITHETQRGKRCRAAVDEIAYEPQAVLVAVESERAEQHPQLLEAALDVADRVDGHFGSVPVKQVPGPVPEAWLGAYRSNRPIPADFLDRCTKMTLPDHSLQQSLLWRKSSRNRSFVAWTACERRSTKPRKSLRLQRRSNAPSVDHLPRTRSELPLRPAPRRRPRRSRARKKPPIIPGSATASGGSDARWLPPAPTVAGGFPPAWAGAGGRRALRPRPPHKKLRTAPLDGRARRFQENRKACENSVRLIGRLSKEKQCPGKKRTHSRRPTGR